MELDKYIKNDTLQVIAKPNSPKTEIVGWDENKQALRIAVAAVPDKDKANSELLKFLKKQTGRKVSLIKGEHIRSKTLRFVKPLSFSALF